MSDELTPLREQELRESERLKKAIKEPRTPSAMERLLNPGKFVMMNLVNQNRDERNRKHAGGRRGGHA